MAVLVLVHPGSLCGSASYNLGKQDAQAVRDEVTQDLKSWPGDVLVLDGFLSDELAEYPALNNAIAGAIERSPGFGQRVEADDPDHAQIAVEFLLQRAIAVDTPIHLTGAWYDPTDASGCVNSTRDALQAAGFSNVSLMDSCAEFSPFDQEMELSPGM